jgi:hypothetical protein
MFRRRSAQSNAGGFGPESRPVSFEGANRRKESSARCEKGEAETVTGTQGRTGGESGESTSGQSSEEGK